MCTQRYFDIYMLKEQASLPSGSTWLVRQVSASQAPAALEERQLGHDIQVLSLEAAVLLDFLSGKLAGGRLHHNF